MRPFGLLLIALATLGPIFWFLPHAAGPDAIAVWSQYLGAAALILMAITQVLSTRMVGLQTLFGPLDRMYVLHKWLGIIAMIAILLHDTIDAELENRGARGVAGVLHDIGETLGELSLYGILALIVLSILTFVPYHLWKLTHKFMGAFFVAGAAHFLLVTKPFTNSEPASVYIALFCFTGVISYLYSLAPTTFARLRHPYKVTALTETGGALSIELSPVEKGIPKPVVPCR